MILQALKEYYDRKAADPDSGIAPEGWEWKEIPFLLMIDPNGRFVGFQDTRQAAGKKLRAKSFLVPSLGEKKGNGIKANLFWENIEYMLGIPVPTEKKPKPDADRVKAQHQAFIDKIASVVDGGSAGEAVKRFLEGVDRDKICADPVWPEVLKLSQSLLLAVAGSGPVTDDPVVRQAVDASRQSSGANRGRCLVTGGEEETVTLEPPIRGLRGANPTGASLVSFQKNSGYDSYGKEQGGNAPIGKSASFAYATALNTLMGKDSRQKLQVGDATALFWSERTSDLETLVPSFFDEPPKDDPNRQTEAIRGLYNSAHAGVFATDADSTRFYVLGLSPNAGRIAVRFWQVGTVSEMGRRFRQHFDDLMIAHGPKERDHLPLRRVLAATAVQGESDNIPPKLAGEVMRSILAGLPYPQTLLQAAIRRIHAERHIPYARAALIKACINRNTRFKSPKQPEELKMSLDEGNQNLGYRLGRLFTVLVKIQEDASGASTIKDCYSSASSSPVTIFGKLMRMSSHNLSKLEKEKKGLFVVRKNLLGEVMSGISDFPPHLSLSDQGRFAIGFYHQDRAFYEKKADKE
jgi:CRISPR-associated protein Csd1